MSLSLILAIGAQNAFVLKQGLKGQHVGLVCAICIVSDMILMSAGVFALDKIVTVFPSTAVWAKYFGGGFLVLYGIQHFISALKSTDGLHVDGVVDEKSAYKTVIICLAITWLNPHVYLDTVLLIGSVATQYGAQKIVFLLGAFLGSIVFFLMLGYGARWLRPLFTNSKSWQILDSIIGVVMIAIAYKIVTMNIQI